MIKKSLMITLYLIIGYQAKASLETPNMTRMPAAVAEEKAPEAVAKKAPKAMQNICMIHAGDIGKLKYKGKTYEQAFSKVTDECFQRRTQLFVKNNKQQPDQDRQIQFAESCVNKIKCI